MRQPDDARAFRYMIITAQVSPYCTASASNKLFVSFIVGFHLGLNCVLFNFCSFLVLSIEAL